MTEAERIQIMRAEETARRFTKARFKREAFLDARIRVMCGAPGCTKMTQSGFCRGHWRLRAALAATGKGTP